MSKRPTVSQALADRILALDEALREEFGKGAFQYHITALGRTVAAAHIAKAAHLPDRRIKPKTKKGAVSHVDHEEELPQGFDLRPGDG